MDEFIDFLKEILIPVIIIAIIVIALFGSPSFILEWFSSCKSADLYNRQNGTQYTCSDFFLASDQINTQTQTIKLK